MNKLDHLGEITDEMFAGLQADEAMRLRIVRTAREQAKPAKRSARRFAPALALAAAAVVCVGVASGRLGGQTLDPVPLQIETIAAGQPMQRSVQMIADIGDGASVRMSRAAGGSLFAEGGAEFPMVAVNGAVYRMLATPLDMGASLLEGRVGSVSVVTEQPSLASSGDLAAGLSNVAAKSASIYAVKGLDAATAVAVEVDGGMRLFQRVSYAGKGPGSASFEKTFSVRGKVRSLELSGVGEITGSKANEVMNVLLSGATLKQADASARKQFLTVTLDSGLKLQLGVSGDLLSGCGGWSCPEFFDAFNAALD